MCIDEFLCVRIYTHTRKRVYIYLHITYISIYIYASLSIIYILIWIYIYMYKYTLQASDGGPHLSKKGAITKPLCNPASRKPCCLRIGAY